MQTVVAVSVLPLDTTRVVWSMVKSAVSTLCVQLLYCSR